MFSKRSLPVLLILAFAGILIAFNTSGRNNPPTKYEKDFSAGGRYAGREPLQSSKD
jgi:hypothetical protein